MRIDLGLKGIEFGNAEFLRRFKLFLQKRRHFPRHIVIGIDQIAYLVMIFGAVHRYQGSFSDFTHLMDDRGDTVGNGMGQKMGDNRGQHKNAKIHQNIFQHQGIAPGDQRFRRKNSDHEPARLLDTVKSCVNCFVQDLAFHKIVGGHKGIADRIIIQPVDPGKSVV